jgi:hypothetical protein
MSGRRKSSAQAAVNSSGSHVVKHYTKGKLFGKLSGDFAFRKKNKEDKKRQLKLNL